LSDSEASQIKDLHGGWFDAGDYNKHTSWTAHNVIVLLRAYSENPTTMGYLHYLHRVNPLGLVYLTNMKSAGASHSANTMFHNWFAHNTRWEWASGAMPGPPPEYLVGGPNPHYSMEKCCAAAFGTAGYRCYF
jgi:hypothetical protein